MRTALFLLLATASNSFAFMIGNPGQPFLVNDGILLDGKLCSLRAAFLDDYVYSQSFTGEFNLRNVEEKPPITKLYSETAQITVNLARRLDLYSILGNAKLYMDHEIYGQSQFAWGIGTKALMYQGDNLQVGCDFKFFQSDQEPAFFVSGGLPLNLASDLVLDYQEYQAAVGLSYRTGIFCPYLLGTYINAKITPKPTRDFLIHVPGFDEPMDASMKTFISRNTWGLAVGASLMMGEKGTLAIESRFLNQNAIDVSMEVRF